MSIIGEKNKCIFESLCHNKLIEHERQQMNDQRKKKDNFVSFFAFDSDLRRQNENYIKRGITQRPHAACRLWFSSVCIPNAHVKSSNTTWTWARLVILWAINRCMPFIYVRRTYNRRNDSRLNRVLNLFLFIVVIRLAYGNCMVDGGTSAIIIIELIEMNWTKYVFFLSSSDSMKAEKNMCQFYKHHRWRQ